MNEIMIPYQTINTLISKPFYKSIALKYLNISKMTFDEFHITSITSSNAINLINLKYEFIEYEDLPDGVMEDYEGHGKVIKYTNFFDKKDQHKDLTKESALSFDMFAITSMYIHPQIVVKDGVQLLDLYFEPADDCYDFERFSVAQKTRRATQAIIILDYIESHLRKERHLIRKLMPNPKQIEIANKTGQEYRSKTIEIKNIIVQYVYSPHEQRKYQRHCEAWGVRGHYRHYKNGKVIFIKPHIKGTGKIKHTQYIMKE